MMILGLGMAVTVAPLTTIVMSSVSQERVGSASGINNAVSRIAGLLAIATLGVLLYHVFDRSLEQKTQSLSPEIRQQIDQQRSRLAAAEISDRRGQEAVNQAFIAGYRAVVWIAAGLAVAGSLSAAVLIGGESHDRY